MKNKNDVKNNLSPNALRQLEVLGHYYKVDYENKVVVITINIKDPSEIVLQYIGDKKNPRLDDAFLEFVSKSVHAVPYGFSISFDLKVQDYKGYKHQDLMNSIEDALEIFSYEITKEKKIGNIKMSLLIAAGVIIFAWLFYICAFKIFGEEDVTHNIVHEVVYTVACVLLWEGIYILFLPSDEYNSISYSILKRIKDIALLDKNNKVLIRKNLDEIKINWIQESKKEKRYKRAFLIVFTAYFAFSISSIPELITLARNMFENPVNIASFIISAAVVILLILTAISTLSFYNDMGKIRKAVLPLNIASLLLVIGTLIIHLLSDLLYNKRSIFWYIVTVILFIVSIIGIIGAVKLKKKREKQK